MKLHSSFQNVDHAYGLGRNQKLHRKRKVQSKIYNSETLALLDTRQNTKINITKTQHKILKNKKWATPTPSKTNNKEYWLLGECQIVLFGAWTCLPQNTRRDRRGCDRMVVRFTTAYAISAYHHICCKFGSRSWRVVQHYAMKFVSDMRQVGSLLRVQQ